MLILAGRSKLQIIIFIRQANCVRLIALSQ